MPRRKKKSSEINLDSLLDTLFNVVGILVLILVMVMLEASEVVKRAVEMMADLPEISIEDLEERHEEIEKLKELLAQLEADKKDLEKPVLDTKLTKSELDQLIAKLSAALAKLPDMKYDINQIRKTHEERQKQSTELQTQMTKARQELAELLAKLAKTPKREAPPDIEVSIPQPRDTPKGVSQRLFLCRGGRLIEYREADLIRKAEQVVRKFNRRKLPDSATHLGGYPAEDVVAYFEKFPQGKPFFRLEMLDYTARENPYMYLRVHLNDDEEKKVGATAADLASGKSTFESIAMGLNRAKQYAYFEVWEDSFDVYVEARKICEKANALAGWKPLKMNERWPKTIRLDTRKYRFYMLKPKPKPPKPKPPPKPAPKPKPADEKPPPLRESLID